MTALPPGFGDWVNTWFTPEDQAAQQRQLEGQIAQRALSEGWTQNGDTWTPPVMGQSGQLPTDAPSTNVPPSEQPVTPASAGDASAVAALRIALDTYGLAGLGETIWKWHLEGKPIEQIMLDLRNTPEYKARFPAMSVLGQKGRAMDETAYIEYERAVSGMFRQYGIPVGFYDSADDFANFLINDISIAELAQRVALAADVVYGASPLERAQLRNLYGVDEGHATAYMLDPDRAQPLLQRQWQASRNAASWQNAELGQLNVTEAEFLTQLAPEEAAQAINRLGQSRELFTPLDSGETAIGRATQIGAITGDVSDAEELARRANRRVARFAGSTRYAQSREGLTV